MRAHTKAHSGSGAAQPALNSGQAEAGSRYAHQIATRSPSTASPARLGLVSPSLPSTLVYMSNSASSPRSMPRHSVSVAGVVVRDDGRLLAIRRADNGTWELPGGVLELEETPEGGVRREVLEETGIHVEVGGLTGVYKNIVVGVVALVFRCKLSGGAERLSGETTAVQWLTREEVSERMSEVYAIRLLDTLDDYGPHVRSHDGRRLLAAR